MLLRCGLFSDGPLVHHLLLLQLKYHCGSRPHGSILYSSWRLSVYTAMLFLTIAVSAKMPRKVKFAGLQVKRRV